MKISADCSYRKKYYYSMGEKYSKFRNKGRITITDDFITIIGKRVYPKITRLILFIILGGIVTVTFKNIYALIIAAVICFVIQEYIFLKSENLHLEWSKIKKYEIDSARKAIALSIEDNASCSPVVFQCQKFENIALAFREKIPDRERTSKWIEGIEQRYEEQVSTMAKLFDKFIK